MSDEHVGAAIRATAEEVHAPASLRARLAAAPPSRRRRARGPRLALGAALAAGLAALLLLVTGGGPTVQEVARAALRPPTQPPPAAAVYAGRPAIGMRTDEVGGRSARTWVYRYRAAGVHYTIVAGKPIDRPDGRRVTVAGRPYTLLRDGRTAIVTWEQDGHTCLLASRTLAPDALVRFLAQS